MTVPPPPHDPYSQPTPAPAPGQHSPPPQPGPYGQPSPSGSYGQPSPSYGQPSSSYGQPSPSGPYSQPAPGAGQEAWGGPTSAPAAATAPGAAGPPPGTDLASDLGAALKFASNSLLRNPVTFLVVGLIYSIISVVLIAGGTAAAVAITFPQMEAAAVSEAPPIGPLLRMYAIMLGAMLLCIPFSVLWQAGSGRAGGVVLEGGRPRIGQAMAGPMRVILTVLLVLVITVVGFLLLYVPGLIASVALMYSIPAAVRGASPVEAIKESFSLVKTNLGTSIVLFLVVGVIGSVAGTLILPYLVLFPFVILTQFGMYERLSGRALPEPARG
ncbi:hypothetical protein [Brachybacterium sacelli]|uniref:DUF7847 domain-containing protein n=1 Tax=Brachybacterium sacelli TaxID=173364 RepID=A0ABS4X0H9_9MICO|nr:hypothetical protein [Brachybacterium sacelli]MBP2381886.1 hypothetical protein [Brachybacterium sacelli]